MDGHWLSGLQLGDLACAGIALVTLLGLLAWDAGRQRRRRRAGKPASRRVCTASSLQALAHITTDADIESRRQPDPANVVFNPRLVVLQCANGFAAPVQAKGLRLKAAVAPSVPLRVRGNQSRIRSAVTTLLDNAVKFTEEGVVRIEAMLTLDSDGRPELRFDVLDTGVGIDAETLANLLSADEPGRSTAGHGLSAARRMVNRMGGKMGAESEPRGGSTFWFSVPVDILEAAPAVRPKTANIATVPALVACPDPVLPRPVESGKRILIVVQDVASQVAVLWGVRMVGYSGEIASGTQDALRAWQGAPFALVLLDGSMADTRETTRAIRGLETGCVPIVGMSAAADGDAALGTAIDGRLAKPVCLLDLARTLEHWLGDATPGYVTSAASSDKLSLPV